MVADREKHVMQIAPYQIQAAELKFLSRTAAFLRFQFGCSVPLNLGHTLAGKIARPIPGRKLMQKTTASKTWPYAALLVGIVCIAWSAIFVRWTSIPGPASAFYRLLIPAIVLLPTFLVPSRQKLSKRSYAIIAIGGFFFALDLAFYNTSILQTSAANATLLGNNTPIVVGLLTWLVFRRRPAFSFWIGLALAVAGSAVIMGADLAKHAKFGLGDAMALAAAACFAVYLMATEEIRAHSSTL